LFGKWTLPKEEYNTLLKNIDGVSDYNEKCNMTKGVLQEK